MHAPTRSPTTAGLTALRSRCVDVMLYDDTVDDELVARRGDLLYQRCGE